MPHVPRNRCCYPDASQVFYDPLVDSNWTSIPASVQAALDNLVGRVHSIELYGAGSKKFAGTITGNNILDHFTITHNLHTSDVVVQIFDSSHLIITTQVEIVDQDNVLVTFYKAPGNGITYKVVVVG